ncbi:MAG: hypothetical protein VKL39_11520 [Leptolyngbyaceae bacterium]|nr:hypothetical protein [Leptolyngbyaceae bacterium]
MSNLQTSALTNRMPNSAVTLFAGCGADLRDNGFSHCLFIHWLGDRPRTQLESGTLLGGNGTSSCPVANALVVEMHSTPTTAVASVLTVLYRSILQGIRVLGIRVFFDGDRRFRSGKDDWIPIHHPNVSIMT